MGALETPGKEGANNVNRTLKGLLALGGTLGEVEVIAAQETNQPPFEQSTQQRGFFADRRRDRKKARGRGQTLESAATMSEQQRKSEAKQEQIEEQQNTSNVQQPNVTPYFFVEKLGDSALRIHRVKHEKNLLADG